jgi:hypothetical protein
LVGCEGEVDVGVGVGDGTTAIGDKALRVVDLVDEGFVAGGGEEIFYEVWLVVIEAPLGEVADEERFFGFRCARLMVEQRRARRRSSLRERRRGRGYALCCIYAS